jgi:hypothetical protein
MSQLIKSALVSTAFLFFSASFCLGQAGDKLDAIADSILFKNTNVYYDMSTGEEHRTMMWRDILVLKNGGHTQENYHYTDTPQPHVGLVKEPAKSVRMYDDHWRLTENSAYFTNGTPRTKDIYSYEPSGRSGKIDAYDYTQNKISIKSKLTLDESNRLIKSESRSVIFVDSPLVISYAYDKNNRVIKEEWYNIGYPTATIYQYKYDVHEDMIERRIDYSRDMIITNSNVVLFTYPSYDSRHNWILQNSYYKGKLRGIIERRIVYRK